MKKQESGRSMVEMVGVLAIMGLITAGSFVLLRSGYASQKRSRATDEIDVIASNVRALAAQAEDVNAKFKSLPNVELYGGADDASATGLAKAFLDSDGATPFDSKSVYSVYTTDKKTFTVELAKIGEGECAAMADRAYSNGTGTCNKDIAVITFTK